MRGGASDLIDIESVHSAIAETRALWKADHNEITRLADHERMARLGYVPGPADEALAAAEERSRSTFAASVANAKRGTAAMAPVAPSRPPSYDLRDVNGRNFITPVRNQGNCGSCVAFGTLATMEGTHQLQVQNPDSGIDYSEAQLFYCYARNQGRRCEGPSGGWWPQAALGALDSWGIVDEGCYPYTPGDQNCANLCSDWQRRLTRITGWQPLTSPDDMKNWIATRGPLVTTYSVYADFYYYTSGVYRHVSGAFEGGHCVSCVGYNDLEQYWICKNSWRPTWGEGGFFRIGYGECGIDATMYGIAGTTP